MIILNIAGNWYFFLVFVGGLLGISAVTLFRQSRNVDQDDILRIKPLIIVRNIFLNQAGFYMLYLLVVWTLDVLGQEIFWWTQVFAALECDFFTKRGLLTDLALIITLAATSIVNAATVQTYRNMLDYCFTLFVIHFIVVSIAGGEFPAYGAWWVAIAVGLIIFMILSERLSYHLETMSYRSSLSEASFKSKLSKKEKAELPALEDGDHQFTKKVEMEPKDDENSSSTLTSSSQSSRKGPTNEEKVIQEESKESKAKSEEKEKKLSLRQRKSIEERHLEESNETDDNREEVLVKRRPSSSLPPGGIPSNVKREKLKDGETGKKDSFRAARLRQSSESAKSTDSTSSTDLKQEVINSAEENQVGNNTPKDGESPM